MYFSLQLSCIDLKAISKGLGDKKYFLTTDKPTTIDCTLFGHLAQFLYIPLPFPQKRFLNEECKNLVEYVERIKSELWPDWEQMCNKSCMMGKKGLKPM